MEQVIKEVTAKVLNVLESDVIVSSRLMGGMSNYMYVVNVFDDTYTFRIPGEKSETFVDRFEELENIKRIESLGINNETIYFDTTTGYKIARYVFGTPLSEVNDQEQYLTDVAKTLKVLHDSKLKAKKDYEPYERLRRYEQHVIALNHVHPPAYQELLETFFSYRFLLDEVTPVFCHNDSQISNIVLGQDQMYLLDWEFAGNNDPLYDVACVGNKDFNLALKFLPIYLGREATSDELKRLYVWRAFQCLQWYNVAIFKELIGLSEKLGVNFLAVAHIYLEKASEFLACANKIELKSNA